MPNGYCYLPAAVGLEQGIFEPDGYQSADGGRIKVNGQLYKLADPDACCEKLYTDLIAFYSAANCASSPYHEKFRKSGKYILVDEYGVEMSSDYIGPSPVFAHTKGGMTDPEIGEMLLQARTIGGHMLWPVHKMPTINTSRGGQNSFYDRIDLTLDEIRCTMLDVPRSRSGMVRRAIEAETTWFARFNGDTALDRFKCFIDTFHLQPFVMDHDYKVISMAESDITQGRYVPLSFDEPKFPRNFRNYVRNNLIAIGMRQHPLVLI